MSNDANERIRPYQLTGNKYALYADARQLGIAVQSAVGHYLCGGTKILMPTGDKVDERTKEMVKELARKRDVLIPANAF